jgi:undecaprenyl-diphosphatase
MYLILSSLLEEEFHLNAFDLTILYFINRDLANPVADIFFITLAESKLFLISVIVLALILGWRGSTRIKLGIALALICVVLLDPFTHYILKPLFARPRPCHVLDDLRFIVGCGGRYGFPSNHAVNVFAAMTVLSLFIRRYWGVFIAIAVLVGLSRIYLGRHYPTDVLAGALIGTVLSIFLLFLIFSSSKQFKRYKFMNNLADEIKGALKWKRN